MNLSAASLTLYVAKDAHKFSSAHMTVFPDGTKENLHGHNYQVELEVEFPRAPKFEEMVDFRVFKTPLKELCDAWDEKILLPLKNPHFKFGAGAEGELEFSCCGRRYVLPSDEVVRLDTDNITAENLAVLFADAYVKRILPQMPAALRPLKIRLAVLETRGQGARVERTIG